MSRYRSPTAQTELPRCVNWRRAIRGQRRKVRRELDEEWADVAVEEVETVMIGHRRRPRDPRIGVSAANPATSWRNFARN